MRPATTSDLNLDGNLHEGRHVVTKTDDGIRLVVAAAMGAVAAGRALLTPHLLRHGLALGILGSDRLLALAASFDDFGWNKRRLFGHVFCLRLDRRRCVPPAARPAITLLAALVAATPGPAATRLLVFAFAGEDRRQVAV